MSTGEPHGADGRPMDMSDSTNTTVETEIAETETAETENGPNRRPGVALAVVLAMLVAGMGGIAMLAGRDEPLPLLPIGASGATEDRMASAMLAPSVEYRLAPGLTAPAESANAFRLGTTATQSEVAALRDALGLRGEVRRESQASPVAWSVTDGNRVLSVEEAPGSPWYLNTDQRNSEEKVRCEEVRPMPAQDQPTSSEDTSKDGVSAPHPCVTGGSGSGTVSSSAASSSSVSPDGGSIEPCPMPPCPDGQSCIQACPAPRPEPAPVRPTDLPTQDEARRIAAAIFAVTPTGKDAALRVDDGFSSWIVTATPTVGGVSTVGMEHTVSVGSKGVIDHAYGMLGTPEEVGAYPLVSLEKAVERLTTGISGYGGHEGDLRAKTMVVEDSGLEEGKASSGTEPVASGGTEPGFAPGMDPDCAKETVICDPPPPVDEIPPGPPPAPTVVTLTSVRVALQMSPSLGPNGVEGHLVPVFVFTASDGGGPWVWAVADKYLDTTTPQPSPEPVTELEPAPRPIEGRPTPVPAEDLARQ